MKKLPKLERYNQIVWAVIGSGVIVVAAVSVLIVLAAILYALLKPDRGAVPVEVIEGAAPATQKLARYDFCHPIAVHGSSYQLIRIASDRFVVRNRGGGMLRQKYDSFSSKESTYYEACGIYGSQGPSAIVNVLFRHADRDGMHLFLKQNAVIHTVEYPQPASGRRKNADSVDRFPPQGTLYWEISFEDSNGDNVIDEHDDQGAYLSDAVGRNLVRITPPLSRALQKSYDGKRKLLLMRVVRDTNGDKSIDEKDAPSLIEVNVAQRKLTREVLDTSKLTEFMRQAEPKRPVTENR